MLTALFVVLGLGLLVLLIGFCAGWTTDEVRPARIPVALLIAVGYIALVSGIGKVNEGERGVVLHNGAATGQVLDPGLYWVAPVIGTVEEMSVMTEAASIKAEGASKDLQVIHAEITVNYAMLPERAVEVYRALRHDAVARVIRPAIEEAVKAGTSEFKAEDLIQHRALVKEKIESILRTRMEAKGFTLDTVSITDFDFSDTFNQAIESKVTATQMAMKAGNDLERVKAEAQQQVERAKAEAEALKAQREAVTPDLILLRRTEALLKAIEKWDGRMPTYVGPDSPVPMLDVFKIEPHK